MFTWLQDYCDGGTLDEKIKDTARVRAIFKYFQILLFYLVKIVA